MGSDVDLVYTSIDIGVREDLSFPIYFSDYCCTIEVFEVFPGLMHVQI